MTSDYQCKECSHLWEYQKNFGESFPKSGELSCPECDSKNTVRIYSVPAVDVAEGMCGNAKNGYSKGVTYVPSPYTPKSSIKSKDFKTYDV